MSRDFKLTLSLALGTFLVLVFGGISLTWYLGHNDPNPFRALAILIEYVLAGVIFLIIEYISIIIWAIIKTKTERSVKKKHEK